jgi:hypothetical protein
MSICCRIRLVMSLLSCQISHVYWLPSQISHVYLLLCQIRHACLSSHQISHALFVVRHDNKDITNLMRQQIDMANMG